MTYVFRWKTELLFALATFLVYVGSAFIASGDAPVTDWGDWAVGVSVAGARAAVAALIGPLAGFLGSRGTA